MAEELDLVTSFTADEAPSMENFNARIAQVNAALAGAGGDGPALPEECLVTILCYDSSGNVLREMTTYAPPPEPSDEDAAPDFFKRHLLVEFVTPQNTDKVVVKPPEGFAFQAFWESFGARLYYSTATYLTHMWGITTPEGYASFGPGSPGYYTGYLDAAYVALHGTVGIEIA